MDVVRSEIEMTSVQSRGDDYDRAMDLSSRNMFPAEDWHRPGQADQYGAATLDARGLAADIGIISNCLT